MFPFNLSHGSISHLQINSLASLQKPSTVLAPRSDKFDRRSFLRPKFATRRKLRELHEQKAKEKLPLYSITARIRRRKRDRTQSMAFLVYLMLTGRDAAWPRRYQLFLALRLSYTPEAGLSTLFFIFITKF